MAATAPPSPDALSTTSPPVTPTDAPTVPSSTNGNDPKREEKLKELKRKQKREKILRRAIPIFLTVPWFVGVIWAALHPLVSVVTGELKCRGQYIDENGLDVHRHRVEKYPLERVERNNRHRLRQHLDTPFHARKESAEAGEDEPSGMCDAIYSERLAISSAVECLHHAATETLAFDVVRILPSMGPVIESTEAVVLVVGEDGDSSRIAQPQSGNKGEDWYERSDINASILHLIKKLGNKKDCPWLTKTVFIVSPTAKTASAIAAADSSGNHISSPLLGSVVDAFISSYLGDGGSSESHTANISVRPLPPDFTFPMIRSVLVLSDVETTTKATTRTEVRILPQGVGGTLPNLDLVFGTFLSLQSHPAGDRYRPEHSIYYGDSDFRIHPFGGAIEERVGQVLGRVGSIIGLKSSTVGKYAKDLSGLFGFVAGMAIGPRQPHASALNHGIDALTIEVRIPGRVSSSSSIHPHYADLTRCVEHLIRSISNLHERLHHSVAQYTMPSPSKFVSHGEYIYPAILTALPMIVRAVTLSLRDIKRFQFLHAGMVLGSVCVASSIISLWAMVTNRTRDAEDCNSEWFSHAVFFILYCIVVLVARQNNSTPEKGANADKQAKQIQTSNSDERQKSLRFISCLVGIYLHAPLLLANYSLGFPSSVFWSPLLATLVLGPSMSMLLSRNKVLLTFSIVVKCLLLLATSPPIILVPRIFQRYTPYVLGVYTPLHLLLAALWFA